MIGRPVPTVPSSVEKKLLLEIAARQRDRRSCAGGSQPVAAAALPLARKVERHGRAPDADLLVGIVHMLVGEIAEELVLNDRPANSAARRVAMQLRIFLVGGNIGILVEEERRGVQRIGAAMHVGRAVNVVGARGGAHINVRAAGGALLRVVHGGVDANFLNGFRSGSGQGLADREIGRRGALNHARRCRWPRR